MTNPMFNPQPNYSGVTIQIANPAVNVGNSNDRCNPCINPGCSNFVPNGGYVNQRYLNGNWQSGYATNPQNPSTTLPVASSQYGVSNFPNNGEVSNFADSNIPANGGFSGANNIYPNTYPAQYYLNNYNYGVNGNGNGKDGFADINEQAGNMGRQTGNMNNIPRFADSNNTNFANNGINNDNPEEQIVEVPDNSNFQEMNSYKMYADTPQKKDNDMTKSKNIIGDLDEREAEIQQEKKNTKEKKIVALTDEYIKSLENYLNNPNDEIRLMASKEILTRLDEDKDRYNDAALNALLNKMMQDPSKLVRIAALSAFASNLASGNDYTVQLLHKIQSNPNADKEDVLQAADILLKMSAGVEVKNIPNPAVKDNNSKKA